MRECEHPGVHCVTFHCRCDRVLNADYLVFLTFAVDRRRRVRGGGDTHTMLCVGGINRDRQPHACAPGLTRAVAESKQCSDIYRGATDRTMSRHSGAHDRRTAAAARYVCSSTLLVSTRSQSSACRCGWHRCMQEYHYHSPFSGPYTSFQLLPHVR